MSRFLCSHGVKSTDKEQVTADDLNSTEGDSGNVGAGAVEAELVCLVVRLLNEEDLVCLRVCDEPGSGDAEHDDRVDQRDLLLVYPVHEQLDAHERKDDVDACVRYQFMIG